MKPLFKIIFMHSYFASGAFNGCQLRADTNTQDVINRFRLTTKITEGIFALYLGAEADVTRTIQYLHALLGNQPLVFYVIYRADEFASITELPLNWVGQLEFSSKKIIHENAVSPALTLAPQLSARSVFKDDVIALVAIYPEDLLATLGAKNINYRISFSARKAHWIYYVINRSQIKLKNPMIVNQQKIQFVGPDEVTLSNGESALCFNSGDQLFPMQKNPQEIFNLVDKVTPLTQADNRTIEHCLIKGLPTPKDDQLNVKQIDGNQYVFFAMHVYL